MLAQLFKRWNALRASYWFLPTVMALAAALMAYVAILIDTQLGTGWTKGLSYLPSNQPAGARAMLSTIAGSMITVAGVTFSITIAAVAYTTSQFGPRLLGNFMRDTGNQVTLGTFIATFLYCLLVLRTVRSGPDTAFVPHLALLGALLLALASIAVLIYFIHHVPESIHISNVIADIGRSLARMLAALPVPAGAPPGDEEAALPDGFASNAARIRAGADGYVQNLVESSLLETARSHDLQVQVLRGAGDYVHAGEVLMLAAPAAQVDEDIEARLHGAYALGRVRTVSQDPIFLVNELIEIAGRALSPGVNDPFTAMGCLDWLRGALAELTEREDPSPYRHDDDGALRLVVTPITFTTVVNSAFDALRGYLCADRNASLHALDALARLIPATEGNRRACLQRQADALLAAALHAQADPVDQAALRDAHARMDASATS